MNDQNPSARVPSPKADEPLGDRGQGDKSWTPPAGEQGISNRVGDDEPAPETDATSFGHDGADVVSLVEEDPTGDQFDEDDEAGDHDDDDAEDSVPS